MMRQHPHLILQIHRWIAACSLCLFGAALVAAEARGSPPPWSDVTIGPGPNSTVMAYDSGRNRTVMVTEGKTWEWDGNSWDLRTTTGPASRGGHAMAYDSARGVTVLFGGFNFDDTWEWDGATWTQRFASGPSVRYGHAMAYDSVRARVVLFGGSITSNPFYSGQTWEWDGTAWVFRPLSGPSGRRYHAMAFDSARGVIVLFGGYGFGAGPVAAPLGDTWEYNGVSWTLRSASSLGSRYGHAMAFDTARARVVLFGGDYNSSVLRETWEWDGTSWVQRIVASPPARAFPGMAYDSLRGKVVLFGGTARSALLGDTWEYDGSTWVFRGASAPGRRYGHAMAYDVARGNTLLFGGFYGSFSLGDTWEWNGASWNPRFVAGPPGRDGHAMVFDPSRSRVVVFGGKSSFPSIQYLNDLWEWDGASWSQIITTGPIPPPRAGHAMAYDTRRNRLVIFGGNNGANLGDTWEWDGAVWTQRAMGGNSPAPRAFHSMVFGIARGYAVLFGGAPGPFPTFDDDTWAWNGSSWTLLSDGSTDPSLKRYNHAMVYDSHRGRIVMYGGFGDLISTATWEWNGTSWARVFNNGPPYRYSHAMAFDSSRGKMVLFGGRNPLVQGNPPLGDTWEYTRRLSQPPSNQALDDMNTDINVGEADIQLFAPVLPQETVGVSNSDNVTLDDVDELGEAAQSSRQGRLPH